MIRLRDIDPAKLAEETHDAIVSRAQRLAFQTGYDLVEGGAGVSNARYAVRELAHYARTGEPPEGRPELVPEYLQTMVDLDLIPERDVLEGERADPDEPIHVVVLAALARERLDERRPVPDAWLAALGSISSTRVRQLVASGELTRAGDGVSSTDARRWLAGRG